MRIQYVVLLLGLAAVISPSLAQTDCGENESFDDIDCGCENQVKVFHAIRHYFFENAAGFFYA